MNHDAHPQAGVGEGNVREVGTARIEELLRGVSHDLKSPLSAIMMTAASLSRIPIDERATPTIRRKAETIQRCAERMAKVIDDLLDVASLQCGTLAIEPALHDAGALFAEALQKVGSVAGERGIALHTASDPSLPTLACDGTRIVQAMTGMLTEAIAQSEEGGELVTGAKQRDGELLFFVETGAGAGTAEPAQELADERPRRRSPGVGLAIARGIVTAHGGRMWSEGSHGRVHVAFAIPIPHGGGRS